MVMHLTANPFQHVEDSAVQSDAILSAAVTQTVGRLVVMPRLASDRTHIGSKDERAEISFGVSGNGRAVIEVQVGIDAKNTPAGRHHTTVVMTITSN